MHLLGTPAAFAALRSGVHEDLLAWQ